MKKAPLRERPPDIPRPDRILRIIAAQYDGNLVVAALEGKLSAEEYLKLEREKLDG